MNKIRRSIKRIFGLYTAMFACLVISVIAIELNTDMSTSSYNPRMKKEYSDIMRGEIRDYNGVVLVETIKSDIGYKRNYIYDREFAHILGYSKMGKTGVEAKYNFELTNVNHEIINRIKQLISGTDLKGNNVILTLDKKIQDKAYELLGNKKGSIIALEPSTGRILAMVSYPNFNPNTIEQDWEQLKSDSENSPLINRCTQGLYAPGSIYKIVTALAAMENIENWQNISYDCLGEKDFTDGKIRCYESEKHGIVDLKKAFAVSCNTSFASLGKSLEADVLKKTSEKLGFNKNIDYPLEYNQSTFLLTQDSTEHELIQTSIGQGRTLTTPFEMLRIVSAVANGGMLMKPYIFDHIEDTRGGVMKKQIPQKEKQMFSQQNSDELVNMMIEVVNNGTGISAKIENVEVAGKTGTAEVEEQKPHAWFVGFAPAHKPQVAVVVLLENSGTGGLSATPIAREIIKTALEN